MLFDRTCLKYEGRNVEIGNLVKIVHPELVEIGDNTRIDDFTVLVAGEGGISIGRYVHIASLCIISGGGRFAMGDFSTLSGGVKVYTGTDDYRGGSMTNPCVPTEFVRPTKSHVIIRKHVVVGTNTVILPHVELATGVAVGACSLVKQDMPEWTICFGTPCRTQMPRQRDTILRMEHELETCYGHHAASPASASQT